MNTLIVVKSLIIHSGRTAVPLLRAVDRFALSIDCSARTIDLSFAHQSIDRATTDGSRNNQSIVQQVACAINRTHLNSNAPRSRLIAHVCE